MIRVLWADDQAATARTLAGALPVTAYEVVYAEDGASALELLEQGAFDIVLLDLLMPPDTWGGLWLLERMRERDIVVPVIVVSGEGSQMETISAVRLGARDYVVKDRIDLELIECIARVLFDGAVSMIGEGESYRVEFKASANWDIKADKQSREMEQAVVRAVAGFLNGETGGTLFIGVHDDGSIVGLDKDYATLRRSDRDGFENWLVGRIVEACGKQCGRLIRVSFPRIEGTEICRVTVRPSSAAVYVKRNESEELYVRTGNSTRALSPREAVEYCQQRWPLRGRTEFAGEGKLL